MKDRTLKFITIAIFILFSFLFIAKFAGSQLLKLYVRFGIGDCHKIPVLCMEPQERIIRAIVNKDYLGQLIPYNFPKMTILLPKDFTVYQEKIKKVYYKKYPRGNNSAAIYLLYREPDFFISLYPQVAKQGLKDNFEFVKTTMYANPENIRNLRDTFFVIMKGIFIPDLGNQNDVVMAKFEIAGKYGFINYNLGNKENYFDCNVLGGGGDFFKVYIKDRNKTLDLEKVLTIISTASVVK
jgi:hypothetical protein